MNDFSAEAQRGIDAAYRLGRAYDHLQDRLTFLATQRTMTDLDRSIAATDAIAEGSRILMGGHAEAPLTSPVAPQDAPNADSGTTTPERGQGRTTRDESA